MQIHCGTEAEDANAGGIRKVSISLRDFKSHRSAGLLEPRLQPPTDKAYQSAFEGADAPGLRSHRHRHGAMYSGKLEQNDTDGLQKGQEIPHFKPTPTDPHGQPGLIVLSEDPV